MNEPVVITLPIVPPTKTHQDKKIVRIGKHSKLADTKELKQVTSDYLTLLQPYKPSRPFTGPVHLGFRFVFPYRKSEPKKNRVGLIAKTTKPDWDNMAKTLQDVMTKLLFWQDDAQVFSASVDKWWGEEPGITISIQSIERRKLK